MTNGVFLAYLMLDFVMTYNSFLIKDIHNLPIHD